ncbi:D-arabinitol dehydrogenase 1 [Sphaceloma murrayae]|uniref:D-arabinitol dehydrogenase 1 n=1 Tax=Sphaceloma murrayae TaxID=2082308 RepID=A0A2K1QW06_9PEZI|nr:D-arabinitol dehydrogenase 1 [Sphaceloma murrayae]
MLQGTMDGSANGIVDGYANGHANGHANGNGHTHPHTNGNGAVLEQPLPETMKALWYEKPMDYKIVQVPLPQVGEREVLVKISACGVCATDLHIHLGDMSKEFSASYPLIPGHEAVGTIVQVGSKVSRLRIGQKVACGANSPCNDCYFCLKGELLLCENMTVHGVRAPGGFAEYCAFPSCKAIPYENLSDLEACLCEPASCAVQMLNRISPKPGDSVLVFGAGPAGLLLSQLLGQNGGYEVTIVSIGGAKLDQARLLNVATHYVELTGTKADAAILDEMRSRQTPAGWDVVVDATGVEKVIENALSYVRRGGKLAIFGIASCEARVTWAPTKILGDQITIIGSVSEVIRFPTAVDYLDSGRIRVKGIANRKFTLEQWAECLESVKHPDTVKPVIVFE